MRKLGIIGVILISLFFPNLVKADTVYYQLDMQEYNYNNFKETKYNNQNLRDYFVNIFNNQSNYNYYIIYTDYYTFNPSSPVVEFVMFNSDVFGHSNQQDRFGISLSPTEREECNNCHYHYSNGEIQNINDTYTTFVFEVVNDYYYSLIDTNYDWKAERNYTINGITETSIDLKIWDTIPSLYSIENPSNMTEVNLDNYYYVLLSLKDYSQNEPFTTNLQVKGQVGITPIYNYGQTTKDAVTGVKVQDRCNVAYENFTNYPLYILKQDLQNNAIYAVKKCSNNSAFKYDNTIFNITYVTNENKDDPVITIDGKQYHTIPFDDLPSTANKNEEENYIPGESGSANSEGGLSSALKGIQQKISEIWDIITFFSGFVNTMFSILPEPIRIILLSAFAIAITLGLIKIFIN